MREGGGNPYDLADALNANLGAGRPPPGPPNPPTPRSPAALLGRNEPPRQPRKETSFQLVSGFVKQHLSPSVLRRRSGAGGGGGGGGGGGSGQPGAFPLPDPDDPLFHPNPIHHHALRGGGGGWSEGWPSSNPPHPSLPRTHQPLPHGYESVVRMRETRRPLLPPPGLLHNRYRHSIGAFLADAHQLEVERVEREAAASKIYEELDLPDWVVSGVGGPQHPPPPPAPRGPPSLPFPSQDPHYAPFLPPPKPITPYSGFIHNKLEIGEESEWWVQDNEIIRPIAFKPVNGRNGGGSNGGGEPPRGRSAEAKSSLSSPEPTRRPLYSDPDGTYSDTGSSLYGLPRGMAQRMHGTSPGQNGRPRTSEGAAGSSYSSPGAPSRPKPIYQSSTGEPLYGNLGNFQPKTTSTSGFPSTQPSLMGTGFAIPPSASQPQSSTPPKSVPSENYDSVPDILRQFEAKLESGSGNGTGPRTRRFPSEPRLDGKKSPGEGLSAAAAGRLASYGDPSVSTSNGGTYPGGTSGSHGSRHSSGVHGVTPSPSDSGVVELEAALRTKEEELGELRSAMEANEAVIVRVYQEKEARWQAKLAEWAARLEASVGTEQRLLTQVQRLQDEKNSVARQVHTLSAEKAALQRKMRELEERVGGGGAGSACRKCGDTISSGTPEGVRAAVTMPNGGLRPPTGGSGSHSPTPAEEIRGEVDGLRKEVAELRNSLGDQVRQYSLERQRWEEEKAKVVSYQKLLQANYVSVFERNQKLEGILRVHKLGTASGDDSESELKRLASTSPTSPDKRGDIVDLSSLDFSTV